VAGLAALIVLAWLISLASSRLSSYLPWTSTRGYRPIDHVILIIVDTLRPDALSCYNPDSGPTPHIDRLAQDGILFTNAFSVAPWTLPSVASIMTGLSPTVHLALRPESRLADTPTTLAECMRDEHYMTAAIGVNIFLKPEHNLSQGFDEYHFYKPPIGEYAEASAGPEVSRWSRSEIGTAELTGLAVEWLIRNRGNRFFLWIHYFDPHIPYAPPVDFIPGSPGVPEIGESFGKIDEIRDGRLDPTSLEKEWIRELYHGEVRYIDENVGKIIDTLVRLDLYDSTLIIFMSDHGEEFWEHGGFEHGHSLYNEVLRVPLIIRVPGTAPRGRRIDMVSLRSIMPTVLDLCDIDYEEEISSYSLASLWESDPEWSGTRPIVSTGLLYGEGKTSVIMDGMKYIRSDRANREELFHLDIDPGEQRSVAGSSPVEVQKAIEILTAHADRSEIMRNRYRITGEESVEIDAETMEWLKSLGYLR
jgi:arylsulfatase A-like enzyme